MKRIFSIATLLLAIPTTLTACGDSSDCTDTFKYSCEDIYSYAQNPILNHIETYSIAAADGDQLAIAKHDTIYIYRKDNQSWYQEDSFEISSSSDSPFNAQASSLSLSNDTLAVGDLSKPGGLVQVFRNIDGTWRHETNLRGSGAIEDTGFGWSTALEQDTLVVSASKTTGSTTSSEIDSTRNTGAVYVFQRLEDNWTEVALLEGSQSDQHSRFGSSISLDRDQLVVGSPGEGSEISQLNIGAVYVFTRTNQTWTQTARIRGDGPSDGYFRFGELVMLEGNQLMIRADNDQYTSEQTPQRLAYTFNLNEGTWKQVDISSVDG